MGGPARPPDPHARPFDYGKFKVTDGFTEKPFGKDVAIGIPCYMTIKVDPA